MRSERKGWGFWFSHLLTPLVFIAAVGCAIDGDWILATMFIWLVFYHGYFTYEEWWGKE